MAADPKELVARFSALKGERGQLETHWQEIAEYMIPRRADITFTRRTLGDKRMERVFDGTAMHSLEILASALHGMLTGSATRWFSLTLPRTQDAVEILDDYDVKEWLEAVAETIYAELGRSNFETQLHELYLDLGAFGTGCMFVEWQSERLRFHTRHMAEVFVAEDLHGRVDTLFRCYKETARQLVQRFGQDKVGKRIEKIYAERPDETVEILHVVMPRDDRVSESRRADQMPMASIYIDHMDTFLISETGYSESPFVAPRWLKAAGESYGRSPGMTALPDTKVANKMTELMLKAAAKMIDPPILVEDDGVVGQWRLAPGSILQYRSGSQPPTPLDVRANLPLGLELVERHRDATRRAFYTDLLQFAQGPEMTATEVLQRTEQQLRLLGPVLGRLTTELLNPLIDRVFAILMRERRLPDAPPLLEGFDLRVEYQSPLARAQKGERLTGLERGLTTFASLSQLGLPVFDRVDVDEVVDEVQELTGFSPRILLPRRKAEKIRAARQQAQAQASGLEQAATAAGAAVDATAAAQTAGVDLSGLLGGAQAG